MRFTKLLFYFFNFCSADGDSSPSGSGYLLDASGGSAQSNGGDISLGK